jgi:hypothetical protein
MRHVLALPDYNQDGIILAIVDGVTYSLDVALQKIGVDIRRLPESCVLGIPAPLLRKNREQEFTFSQIVRLENCVLIISARRAGNDISDRTVFLTEIISVEKDDLIKINKTYLLNNRVECFGCSQVIQSYLDQLRERSYPDIEDLVSVSLKNPKYIHLASQSLMGMNHKPDWVQKKRLLNPHRSIKNLFVILFIVCAIIAFSYFYFQFREIL